MTRRGTGHCYSSEQALIVTVLVATGHRTCVQTHRRYNTQSELSGKPWAPGDDNVSMQVHRSLQMSHLA